MVAPRPAAGPTLAFLQLLLGPPNAARPGGLLLGILDPADELVAGQWRDVIPSIECRRVGEQRLTEVRGQLMHHPTGHPLASLDQAKLGGAGKPLDPSLFNQRGGSIGDRKHNRELNRSAAARVAAGGTGAVRSQTALDVGCPPAVERVVSAAQ